MGLARRYHNFYKQSPTQGVKALRGLSVASDRFTGSRRNTLQPGYFTPKVRSRSLTRRTLTQSYCRDTNHQAAITAHLLTQDIRLLTLRGYTPINNQIALTIQRRTPQVEPKHTHTKITPSPIYRLAPHRNNPNNKNLCTSIGISTLSNIHPLRSAL